MKLLIWTLILFTNISVAQFNDSKIKDLIVGPVANYLIKEYFSEIDLDIMSVNERKFQLSLVDLNGDGMNEIFVYLNSRFSCGSGGCTFLLMDKDINLITKFTVTRAPILVSDKMKNGWKILYMLSNGYREMVYNIQNKSYPTNPSVEKEIKVLDCQINTIRLFDLNKKSNNLRF